MEGDIPAANTILKVESQQPYPLVDVGYGGNKRGNR